MEDDADMEEDVDETWRRLYVRNKKKAGKQNLQGGVVPHYNLCVRVHI